MQKHRFTTTRIAGAALALAFSFTAQAQNNRSFVATTGDDTNTCLAGAYCRTFARALAVTNSGGEIVVVNSGGYGSFSITQPVTITAIGVDASITETTSGQSAITIHTTGNVTITGLNLNGGGAGFNGVLVTQVGVLRLYNMQIQSFINNGIEFDASGGNLDVEDSKISDCQNLGLLQSNGQGYVHNTEFNNNVTGAAAGNVGSLTIADSSAQYSATGFYVGSPTSTLYLYNNRASFNTVGIKANAGKLYFADCVLTGNTTDSWFVAAGATLASSNPATDLITPGQSTGGTLSTATVLQ
jgi:hypothetical protein